MADHDTSRPSGGELPGRVSVVNVGLALFGDAVRAQGAAAVDVAWRIPGGGRPDLVRALAFGWGPRAAGIDAANREVCRRLDTASPLLVGLTSVAAAFPDLGERVLLHPGPPLDWEAFCDPLRRSARAAAIAEGWAADPEGAERLLSSGAVALEPAHGHGAAVPMATVLGPSAPLLVVESPQGANRAYSGINQGPGGAWFGVESPEAVARLTFLRDAVGPVLAAALDATGPIDVFSLAAQGLQMGDDAHMRTQGRPTC